MISKFELEVKLTNLKCRLSNDIIVFADENDGLSNNEAVAALVSLAIDFAKLGGDNALAKDLLYRSIDNFFLDVF